MRAVWIRMGVLKSQLQVPFGAVSQFNFTPFISFLISKHYESQITA